MLNSLKIYNTKLSESEIIEKLKEICEGLQILHNKEITHGRLSTKSIFFSEDGTIQLGDICLTHQAQTQTKTNLTISDNRKNSLTCITKNRSVSDEPIMILDNNNNITQFSDYQKDIKALGPILYQMATLRIPDFKKIEQGKILRIMGSNNAYSATLQHLLNNLMTDNPTDLMKLPKIIGNIEVYIYIYIRIH